MSDLRLAAAALLTPHVVVAEALLAGLPVRAERLDREWVAALDLRGDVVIDDDLALRMAAHGPLDAATTDDPGTSSDAPSTEDDWTPQNLLDLAARPPEPPTIAGLFYPERRHVVSGEYECGKSMLMLATAADEMRAGHGVYWVDADDMGEGASLERLRGFGVDDETIATHFGYVRPSSRLTARSWFRIEQFIATRSVRLAVFDAFNPLLSLHDLDPGKTPDVERLYREVVDPFRRLGLATVLLDHLVKNPEASRRYSYGSERKASGAEVHVGLTLVEPFGRGQTGRSKLTVHKDRPGFLERPSPGLFTLVSDEDGSCSWRIDPDTSRTADGGFRPTGLMEKVSRFLEVALPDARSRNQIENAIEGKREFVRLAIDRLAEEGYAVELRGDRNARLVQCVKAFREVDEWGDE